MPEPIFFPKDLLVEETAQAARRRTRQARAKAQALQPAQTKIARDEDPSGRASKLCLNRGKYLSKYVKTGKPVKR